MRTKVAAVFTTLLVLLAASWVVRPIAKPPAAAAHFVHNRLTHARPPRTPAAVSTLTCPSDTVTLKHGDNLSQVAKTADKTYLLPPGTYTITSTIVLNTPGATTCYQSLESEFPVVNVNVADASLGHRAWVVESPVGAPGAAGLGLLGLVVDGQGTSSGILAKARNILGGVVLEVKDVVFQKFAILDRRGLGGAAVAMEAADATFQETSFEANMCAHEGGALSITNSSVVFTAVRMKDNTASTGGSIYMQGSFVNFEGTDFSVMTNNRAVGLPTVPQAAGGALRMRGGSLTVNGALCAYSNDAGFGGFGGFAYVEGGEVVFSKSSNVNVALNTPNTLVLAGLDALITCSNPGSAHWKAGGKTYTITGPACACNDAFVQGTAATCDGCNGAGWSADTCECKQTTLY